MHGFTLVEIVMSVCIMTVVFAGIISCYIQNAYRAEWTGYSLAAQASACQQLERAKCAVWDTQQTPPMDQILSLKTNANYSRYVNTLDLPVSGTNTVVVTNYSYITNIVLSTTPPVSVYYVKVEAVWPFRWGKSVKYYTNTVADYFAPD